MVWAGKRFITSLPARYACSKAGVCLLEEGDAVSSVRSCAHVRCGRSDANDRPGAGDRRSPQAFDSLHGSLKAFDFECISAAGLMQLDESPEEAA